MFNLILDMLAWGRQKRVKREQNSFASLKNYTCSNEAFKTKDHLF